MPRRPSASGFSLSIDEDFDEANAYRVKLYELEERESQFSDSKGKMAIVWKMNLYRDDDTVFEDPRTGLPFDLWAWTSDSTFSSSKGRGYINAFLGGDVSDEQVDALIDEGFAEGLVGKTARGNFEIYTTDDGNERLRLLLLRPDRKRAQPAPSPPRRPQAVPPQQDDLAPEEPAPAAAAPATPVAPARRRTINDP